MTVIYNRYKERGATVGFLRLKLRGEMKGWDEKEERLKHYYCLWARLSTACKCVISDK